ncbi:putative DNA-binding transcriptional regulator YafY [Saccharothrix longispora]|uniref:DNA-binding transcriptional regulator YafY n=1 Tax=Saccharothrix longispora TaxID=33920 RepID=A0ABU1PT56_9PSEU|nr:putative DNA-binding transcriptional regulator YafY [Saccharothrix longispora]
MAALLLMQVRGRVTAAELAAELEVSVATARRDLEALSSAGVPVYPQPGRGGGWRLVGRARTDLSGLTSSEARALFLLLGPVAGMSVQVRGAVRKLVRALPEPFREDAWVAVDAVVVDGAAWGGVVRGRPGVVGRLEEAVVGRRRVRLVYAGRGGGSERVVEPWGLVDKGGVWYLVAGTAVGRRVFRVDRVVSAEVVEGVFERPGGFDLASVWGEVVEGVEVRRSVCSAVVEVEERFAGVLADQFGRHCVVVGSVGGGRVRVRVGASTPLMVAQVLAGWGGLVEVDAGLSDGVAVRVELGRLGRELVARYGS